MNHETKPPTPNETERAIEINQLRELFVYASPEAIAIIAKKISDLQSGLTTPDTWDTDHNSPPHES